MENMFAYIILQLIKCGDLKTANYYNKDFATIELTKDNKVYSIYVRCEEAKDGKR